MPNTSAKVALMRERLGRHMNQILALFVPGAKITVIIRPPGDVEREVLQTNDDLDEVSAALERAKKREDG